MSLTVDEIANGACNTTQFLMDNLPYLATSLLNKSTNYYRGNPPPNAKYVFSYSTAPNHRIRCYRYGKKVYIQLILPHVNDSCSIIQNINDLPEHYQIAIKKLLIAEQGV